MGEILDRIIAKKNKGIFKYDAEERYYLEKKFIENCAKEIEKLTDEELIDEMLERGLA